MLIRSVLNLLAFAVSVAGMCAGLPHPIPEYVVPTWEAFLRDRADVELLMIGSSHVRYVDIGKFKAEAERRGVPVHALNLGVEGMAAPESEVFLGTILRRNPPRLRWAFIELSPWKTNRYLDTPPAAGPKDEKQRLELATVEGMNFTERSLWWHTPRATLRMLRLGLRVGETPRNMRADLREGLRHVAPLGRGFALLRALREARAGATEPAEPDNRDQVPDAFRVTEEEYAALLARTGEADPEWDRPLNARYFSAWAESLRRRGIRPVFIIPPVAVPGHLSSARDFLQLMPAEEIWSFADPAEFPELFEYRHRRENLHLNRAGYELFARLLADRFHRLRNPLDAAESP